MSAPAARRSSPIGARTSMAPPATLAVNKWIVGEVVETLAELGLDDEHPSSGSES